MQGIMVLDAHTHVDSSLLEELAWPGHKMYACKPATAVSAHVNSLDQNGFSMLSLQHKLEPMKLMDDEVPFFPADDLIHSHHDELPSVEKLMHNLENCKRTRDFAYAETTLVHVCSHGLEPHRMLGHHLIPLFVECGSLEISLQIFSRLDHRDEKSWNFLVQGCLSCGNFQYALTFLHNMHAELVHSSKSIFMGLLKACAKLKSLERAQEVHAEIVKEEFEKDIFVGSTLVDMYIKCGSLTNAKGVFDELSDRNVVSWNALIAGYAKYGLVEEVQTCFEKMEEDGVSPDSITFAFCLKTCTHARSIQRGQKIHASIAREEHESVLFVGHALVDMYAKFGMLLEAQDVFDSLSVRGVIPWTSLMTGYADNGLYNKALDCMKEMQLKGIHLDAVTFACVLKSCGNIKAIDKGRETHAEVVREGLEIDQYIGNALMDMYSKCGLLAEAHEVLNELVARNVFSWTTLITGYAQNGDIEKMLTCLEQMNSENVLSNSITYVCCLKACGNTGALPQGRELHSKVCMDGYENDSFVANTLVDMYAKCGLLEEAHEVFENLPIHDVVSWTALVAGYTDVGLGEEALKCVDQMQMNGLSLDDVTYVFSLKAAASISAVSRGQELHIEIVKVASEMDPFVGNALVDMYAKCGSLDEACDVFVKLPSRDIISWNTLISEYADSSLAEEAVQCLQQMQSEGLIPDRVTYASTLKACSSAGAISMGLKVHLEIVKTGSGRDPYVGNTLLDMYARCGLLEEAKEIFDHLPIQDVVKWNTVLTGLNECDHAEEVFAYLDCMKLAGVVGDTVTYVCSLRACGNLEDIDKAQETHADIASEGFESGPHVGNTLIDTYGRCGLLEEALSIFEELKHHDVVSWNVLIAGYAEQGLCEEVFSCLEKMQQNGVSPNMISSICGLKVCCSSALLYKGQKLHSELVTKGLESDPSVGNSLVGMYARCGSMIEAQDIFEELPNPDIMSWTALIAGFADFGLGDDILDLIERMQLEGLSPDVSTFVCSLKGCGARGQLEWGRRVHLEILKEGLEMDLVVGNTLVDMYAKCGSLVEAQKVLEQMPNRDVISWNALTAAYTEHDLCEGALKFLEEMSSDGVSPNAVTLACSLKAGGHMRCLGIGQYCHMEALKKGYERDGFVGNSLIDMYVKCDAVAEAQDTFDKLINTDVSAWNALISGYVDCGLKEEALNLVEQMPQKDVLPDAISYACGLKACDSTEMLARGQRLHAEAAFESLDKDLYVGNTLVDMYCKCGLITDAREVFDELPVRNVVAWNTLIAGYSEQGLGEEALDVLKQMQMDGMSGDAVTSVVCLKACGSIGAADKGREVHSEIVKVANEGTSAVQNSLVDMYGELGTMVDAFYIFDTQSERGLVGWNALITGYSRHGKFDIVADLLKQMSKEHVQPNEITILIVLTLCSHLGLVEKGQDYLEVMKKENRFHVTIRHLNCMIDLLSRAGQLEEAVAVLDGLQNQPQSVAWSTMLGACRKWGNIELGQEAFQNLALSDESRPVTFILMGNMYAGVQI